MSDWLLHMTEAQRVYAIDLIDAMLDALRTMDHVPTARWSNTATISIRTLPDRRSGASVSLSRGNVILRTPMSPSRLKFAAELVGPACPPIDVITDGDVAIILVTLVGWRVALSSPVTGEMTATVKEVRNALTTLLRGAVHAHRPDWELATLQSSREDGHVVEVFHRDPDRRQVKRRFTNRTLPETDGSMTRELVDEIDRILGARSHVHVVELDRWQRYRLRFQATPTYCMSPTPDPMLTLRTLHGLPARAGLTPAG